MNLALLGDAELLEQSRVICAKARHADLAFMLYLGEIEERRLHLREGFSSVFDYCVRGLGLSEGAAFRRMHGARLVRRFPVLKGHIESGRLHLSGLVMLREHLDESNVDELVERAAGKTKREVEELVADLAPKPDVPGQIRKLPVHAEPIGVFGPSSVSSALQPLGEARYKLQLTASAALRDKIERARELLRHRNPSGELAVVVEYAVDALLEKLSRERLAATDRPQRAGAREAKAERITNAVRREVVARDGLQCSFTSADGRRCESRDFLELDHIEARACGGDSTAANVRVLCRAHNRLMAERTFGRAHVEEQIRLRQRKSGGSVLVGVDADAPTVPDVTAEKGGLPAGEGELGEEHLRQRKSPEREPNLLQRKSVTTAVSHAEASPVASPAHEAVRGLMDLGFVERDARRAVDEVESSAASPPSVVTLVRTALGILTS